MKRTRTLLIRRVGPNRPTRPDRPAQLADSSDPTGSEGCGTDGAADGCGFDDTVRPAETACPASDSDGSDGSDGSPEHRDQEAQPLDSDGFGVHEI